MVIAGIIGGSGVKRIQSGIVNAGSSYATKIGTLSITMDSKSDYWGYHPVSSYNFNENDSNNNVININLSGFSNINKMVCVLEPLAKGCISDSITTGVDDIYLHGTVTLATDYRSKYGKHDKHDKHDKPDVRDLYPYTLTPQLNNIRYYIQNKSVMQIAVPNTKTVNTIYKYTYKTGTIEDIKLYSSPTTVDQYLTTFLKDDNRDGYDPIKESGTVTLTFYKNIQINSSLHYTVIEYY